jgi:sodium transport system permease protein
LYHGESGSASPHTFSAFSAIGVVCAAMGTMLVGAVVAHQLGAPVMVVAVIAQVLMLAVPVAVVLASGRTRAALGLRRPVANRHFAGALLVGASAWYLNMRLVELLPIPDGDRNLLELIDRPSTPVVLLAVALAPAICEEVLFRGVLVRGLATRFFLPFAIVIAALVFSAYHMRVVQLVPTFTLGVMLGYIAVRADSALPGMLAHFVNNAIALVIARGDVPPVASALARHPAVATACFASTLVAGLVLVSGGWERRRE